MVQRSKRKMNKKTAESPGVVHTHTHTSLLVNKNGITLIVLIITVIILLILSRSYNFHDIRREWTNLKYK